MRLSKLTPPAVDFEREASDPSSWYFTAMCLLQAAQPLWDVLEGGIGEMERTFLESHDAEASERIYGPFRVRGPFYLLVGLAIENLVKGLVVMQKLAENTPEDPIVKGSALNLFRGQHSLL